MAKVDCCSFQRLELGLHGSHGSALTCDLIQHVLEIGVELLLCGCELSEDLVFVSEPVLIELRLLLHKDVKLLLQDLVCCYTVIYLGQPVSLSFEPVVRSIPHL